MENDPYKPIDCSLHDIIEDAATLGKLSHIVYETCERQKEVDDVPVDWFTKDGSEFLRCKSGLVLRLDQITEIKPY
jgi:transcriptional antiterminator Rof (Rho-off)